MSDNTKKFLIVAAIAIAVTLVVSNPAGAAATVSGVIEWLMNALQSVGDFITSIEV